MHDNFSREPDPLDGMLRPHVPELNDGFRHQVYAQSRRVLCLRYRLRQFAYAVGLATSFLLGLAVMRLTMPSAPPVHDEPARSATKVESPVPEPSRIAVPESALSNEWIAFDSTESRAELYREAGDRYIKDEYDPQSALRCYANALDNAQEEDLTISTRDNWLLMAIKDARKKEKDHAKRGS